MSEMYFMKRIAGCNRLSKDGLQRFITIRLWQKRQPENDPTVVLLAVGLLRY
jgi:hypothetical protein